MIGVWVWIVKFAGDEGRVLNSGFLCATSVSLCLCGELLLSNVNHRGTETQRLGHDQVMHYHLIGICGTAMASLAGMLQARGHHVTGSDKDVYPPMSTMLQDLGINVFHGYKREHLSPL